MTFSRLIIQNEENTSTCCLIFCVLNLNVWETFSLVFVFTWQNRFVFELIFLSYVNEFLLVKRVVLY